MIEKAREQWREFAQSKPGHRFQDWAEVRLRRLAGFVGKVWRSSVLGKVSVVAVVVLCAGAVAYVAYRLYFG
jgi:hypothetical protein